jgi:hypothetical protein
MRITIWDINYSPELTGISDRGISDRRYPGVNSCTVLCLLELTT